MRAQYKAMVAGRRARLLVSPAVLCVVPLRLNHYRVMTPLACLLLALAVPQATAECKNCVTLGKEEKAMFRAHSDACLSHSGADRALVERLLRGDTDLLRGDSDLLQGQAGQALRRHVYCVLLRCKVIGKDGKLLKATVLGRLSAKSGGRNATKIAKSCVNQTGDSPEDMAWNLFRCGYDKKAMLFDYMPAGDNLMPDGAN